MFQFNFLYPTLGRRILAGSCLALATIGCAIASHQATPEQLFRGLVDVLNTKDKGQITKYLQSNATSQPPIEQRAQRMLGFAKQGAPFSIVGTVATKGGKASARLRDVNGVELDVTIDLVGDPPKLGGLMARPAAAPGSDKDRSGYTTLQALVDEVAKDTGSPALSASVIHAGRSQSVVSGMREVGKPDKVGPDEPFEIGSIGKSLCSTVIGTLIDEGKLHFETTLKDALPGYPMRKEYEGVTLDQIMHHRGGIPADPGMRKPQVEKIVGDAKTPLDIRTNYAKDILSRPMDAKPGTEFIYSNAGYALLSKVAEVATGKPYEELVKQRVFKPLGLAHSFTGDDTLPADHPSGHVRAPDGWKPVLFQGPLSQMFAGAGGGMWMSTSDLAKFGQAHLDGLKGKDGVLKAATVARLHSGVAEMAGGSRAYACGWGIVTERGLPVKHGHNGSDGTFRAELAIYPDLNLVIAAIVNRGGEEEPTPGEEVFWAVAQKTQKGG